MHDGKRGFAVRAGNVTTRDIGTAFDVQMTGPHVTVAVREGIVSVSRQSDPALRLTAGQIWAVDQHTGQAHRGAIEPEDVGSWRSGQMVLNDVRFSDAVAVLGRYYPGTIVTHGLEHDTIPVGACMTCIIPERRWKPCARCMEAGLSRSRQASPWCWRTTTKPLMGPHGQSGRVQPPPQRFFQGIAKKFHPHVKNKSSQRTWIYANAIRLHFLPTVRP
ncbi:FecR domain-containing protein [Komagataeibacter rhaeticus]|nr:FecR domain-containing protein [Komagataeibacter rhaeticus]